MAYTCKRVDETPSNVIPGGCSAGVALSCGELVYLDSSGNWQKADAVADGTALASRQDALGIVTKDYLAYATLNPVKRGLFGGWTGLTIGLPVFLSGTAGAVTQTEPTTTIRQVVGVAVSATDIWFDIEQPQEMNAAGLGYFQSIQMGSSAAPIASAVANEKILEIRATLSGTGDNRAAYIRQAQSGASSQGEAVRAYNQVTGAVTQAHGCHATGEISTGGSVSGQVVGLRATAATAASLTLAGGTINALRLDSDLNSAITGMTEAWIYMEDLNASNKFTKFLHALNVSTTMYATKSGAASTKGLKVSINGDTKYIMICD